MSRVPARKGESLESGDSVAIPVLRLAHLQAGCKQDVVHHGHPLQMLENGVRASHQVVLNLAFLVSSPCNVISHVFASVPILER